MPPRLRPAPRRRPRANPRAEFAALSRTPYRDRPAHHFRLSVPRLECRLSPLLAGSLFPCRRCSPSSAAPSPTNCPPARRFAPSWTIRCCAAPVCIRPALAGGAIRSARVFRPTSCALSVDLSPILRQTVKSQNSANGELTHGIVTTEVHKRNETGCGSAAGSGLDCRRGGASF